MSLVQSARAWVAYGVLNLCGGEIGICSRQNQDYSAGINILYEPVSFLLYDFISHLFI